VYQVHLTNCSDAFASFPETLRFHDDSLPWPLIFLDDRCRRFQRETQSIARYPSLFFLSAAESGFVVSRDASLFYLDLGIARYRRIGKMKTFDPIGGIGDSSAFKSSPRFFPLPLRRVLFPAERIVSIATALRFLLPFFRAINFPSPPFLLLLPGEEGRESGCWPRCAHRKRMSVHDAVVDPLVSHVL
jgi:hypothetical protein